MTDFITAERVKSFQSAEPMRLSSSQIAFYDDPARFAQMTNKLCDELEQRDRETASV